MKNSKNAQYLIFVLTILALLVTVLLFIQDSEGKNGEPAFNKSLYIPVPLETRVIGSNRWLSDTTASLRIITIDHDKSAPAAGSEITATLSGEHLQKPINLFHDKTNSRGTIDANFHVPKIDSGRYELTIATNSAIGTDEIKQSITIEKEATLLLTTDKPLYQPNQIIHIRALALTKPALKPASSFPIIFEIEDPKGNKVFKKPDKTSRFGISAVEFQLADEINLGRYIIRAILQDESKKQMAATERKVNIEKYVLPKFKVQVKPDKQFYLPAETLKADVQADYFFGKPVAEGEVVIKLSTFDFKWNEFAEIRGSTDSKGAYTFESKLPEYFAGIPLEKGNALIKLDATVTDKAEHQEVSTMTLPVAHNAINIVMIPENTQIASNLSNKFYVLTSYPDGRPARTKFIVKQTDNKYSGSTDELGIGEISITPKKGSIQFTITAEDEQGNTGKTSSALTYQVQDDVVLLSTDKAIAKVGESLQLEVISSRPSGTIFIDVVHDKQTFLTYSLDCSDSKASMKLPLDQNLAGTLLIHAYRITPDGQIIRDTKVVYVNPANDLKVSMLSEHKIYLPGKQASLTFSVTDLKGHPVLAALGITIVDESVFAIEEMHPGLEKIYFTLEKELLQPRYEIHGFDFNGIIPDSSQGTEQIKLDRKKQTAARVLFAAATPAMESAINVNTYQQRTAKVRNAWQEYAQKSSEKIWKAILDYAQSTGSYPNADEAFKLLIRQKLILPADAKDPLGNWYYIKPTYGNDLRYGINLISAGFDKKFGTPDDVIAYGHPAVKDEGFEEERFAVNGGVEKIAASPAFDLKQTGSISRELAPAGGQENVRIRQFFPETLFVNPQLITDEKGNATLNLAMADSITTWRSTVLASSLKGQLGSSTFPIRVFQDFFVDIDLPVSLTQHDEMAIPVAIYNYMPQAQSVHLKLEKGDWFESLSDVETSIRMNQGDVSVRYFRIRAKEFGNKKLTVFAYGEKMNDAISRNIEIVPDGKETWETINDRLEKNIKKIISIPKEAIEGASNILVKIYPGAFTQVIEGLDKLLRMPFGCFEQTSSVTYPNVLVTDYMKRAKKINPEIQMKAEQYINLGYQRLLTFEVKGGGFSWFGNAPAHKVLTSYGIMEFHDMSKVHEVDPAVIQRTIDWLLSQQQSDGSWEPDKGGIAEGIINRQTDVLRVTAYIAWALTEAEQKGNAIDRAMKYIIPKINDVDDAYALAVIANALAGWDKTNPSAQQAIEQLARMATEQTDVAYWKSKAPTSFGGKEETGDLETTALAAYALLKTGKHPQLASKALTYLVQHKDAFGTWQSTQATVWTLRAFLIAMEKSASDTNATVIVRINDTQATNLRITPADSDVLRQIDLKKYVQQGDNNVEIYFEGKGAALYQISTKYYLPWDKQIAQPEPLEIDVQFDKKELAVNDLLACNVKITNNQKATANMVIVDLGLPPGFDLVTEDLTALVNSKTIEKYSMTGRQLIIYLDKINPDRPIEFTYHLKAKFPIRAKTGRSIAYEYYAPTISGSSKPQLLGVK